VSETLAVANSNPPLRPEDVAYIELVSSPDPRVKPFVFALEHSRVRVGRFSTDGTYATSSDLFVALAPAITAIAPMNTMFEFVGGAFHVFDTRSVHGTAVNGEPIKKRRLLAIGDVIEIGGTVDDGGARTGAAKLIFHGATPPPGAILRAPPLTRRTWSSLRGSVEIDVDATTGTATATIAMHDDWRDATLAIVARTVPLQSPALPTCTPGDVIRYEAREALTELGRHVTRDEARAIVADMCDAAAACHRASGEPILVGPFERELVWRRANGRAHLFGAGLARRGYAYDRNARGAMMTSRHYRISPEEINAGHAASTATDVYFAAYFLVELVANAEPFPTGETFAYLNAVKQGHPEVPAGLPAEVTRAFDLDPTVRPSMAELAAALRREPEPPRRRSWWSRLFGG
jgi:hypothetical protein